VLLKPPIIFFSLIASAAISNVSARDLHHANESSLQLSRYVNLLPGPTKAQRNPLHMVLPNVTFQTHIKSVGQAIHFLLKNTGYKLTRHHPDRRVFQMFRLSLPKIHRRMGPLTLEQALKTLSGEPWILAVDPINRLVSFQLPDYFKKPAHMRADPITKVITSNAKKRAWDKSLVKLVQHQYRQALKPKVKPQHENSAKLVRKTIHKPNQRNTYKPPLTEITWADLPKELR